MKKRKGFTLIELMIVLAVIAILAVVLVPKAGILKGQAKNSGVSVNVNTVRAYLETKTGDNFFTPAVPADAATELATSLSSFVTASGDTLKNPLNSTASNDDVTAVGTVVQPAVYVCTTDPTLADYKGSVIVKYTSGTYYEIYGVDNGGTKVAYAKILK